MIEKTAEMLVTPEVPGHGTALRLLSKVLPSDSPAADERVSTLKVGEALFRSGQTANEELKSWTRVILSFLPYYIIVCGIVLALQVRPSMSQIYNVLIFLPAISIAAAINAFGEEFEFRSMLLARLEPVFGGQSAILMSSALFGLAHYFGTPGGPLGVVLAGLLGWLLAKSMIETRGFVWAFLLHFIADFIVFGSWATLI